MKGVEPKPDAQKFAQERTHKSRERHGPTPSFRNAMIPVSRKLRVELLPVSFGT